MEYLGNSYFHLVQSGETRKNHIITIAILIMRIMSQHIDKEEIVEKLFGRVFHATNRIGFEGIIRDTKVRHNRDGTFPLSYGQSKFSYGRKRGHVCLYDFREVNTHNIEDVYEKIYFLNMHNEPQTYFLILNTAFHIHLIENRVAYDEVGVKEMYLPHTEVWINKEIPLSWFSSAYHINNG